MNHGSFPVRSFHALEGEGDPGRFEAVVSTYNTRVEGVFYDQLLKPGCFERTLRERGLPAVIWSHEWETPPIGLTTAARETDEGLQVEGRLFVGDDEESPTARQVFTAMRAQGGDGRNVLREFSIGFDIVNAEWEVHDEDEILAISDVNLFEYGPCLVGRNTTRLIEVASVAGRQKQGEVLTDPVLARFPRPRQAEHASVRALRLAHPRYL